MYKIRKGNIYLIVFIILLSIVAFIILKNFIIPIIFTGILVYLFHPVYKALKKILRSHIITSFIMIVFILFITVVPFTFTAWTFVQEFNIISNSNLEMKMISFDEYISEKTHLEFNLLQDYSELVLKSKNYFKKLIYYQLPEFIFNVFIIMFLFYYFLKQYDEDNYNIAFFFKRKKFKIILSKIKRLLNGILYGQILVRLIQGLLGTILFALIGIKAPLIWGFLMFFCAFLPVFGTSIVWAPILILHIIKGEYYTSFLLLIAGILISTIDNLLLPYVISEKTNIGPVITLLSIIGGIQFFGFYGIILGPFFLGLLFVFIEEFFYEIRRTNPRIRRFIWTQDERMAYRKIKTDMAKREFVRILTSNYEKNQESE